MIISQKIIAPLFVLLLAKTVLPAAEPSTIHQAVAQGNYVAVKQFIERDPTSVHQQDKNEKTPLHIAANRGDVEITHLLLKNDAQVNAIDDLGETPLHVAAWNEHIEIARLLLVHGAVSKPCYYVFCTPLSNAQWRNNQAMIDLLSHWPQIWQHYCTARLAFCAVLHSRLGAKSPANILVSPLLPEILQYLRPEDFATIKHREAEQPRSIFNIIYCYLMNRYIQFRGLVY